MPPSVADPPDVTGLIELARDPHLDLKPVVLRVQTDLFVAAPIRDRAALETFESLATGLIPIIDEDTALVVARKLGACPDTPASVLACLSARSAAVRQAVLAAAPGRPTPSNAERARDAGAAHPSGQDIMDNLDQRDPVDPVPTGDVLDRLIANARSHPELARCVLARPGLAPADLAPLWLHADVGQRAAIAEALEATAALRPCPPAPRDLGATLTALSREQDVAGFTAALAAGLGIADTFLACASDPAARYDLLTLAMRAADLREADAIYVFLTLNDAVARSVGRVFDLTRTYRSVTRAAARDLLGAVLGTALPERVTTGRHHSYLAPDAARPRLGAVAEGALARVVVTHRNRRTV